MGDEHDGGYGEGGGYGRRRDPNFEAPRDGRHDYERDFSDLTKVSDDDLSQINKLLGQRLAKKKARQFQDADALQEELRDMGVEVDDRRRVWYMVQSNSY